METEFEFRGEYYPAFFSIFLNGDFDEKFESLKDPDLGTLAHEYLHYIQNVDTLMGLSSSHHFFSLYNEALKQGTASTIPLEDFQLPKIIQTNEVIFKSSKGKVTQALTSTMMILI